MDKQKAIKEMRQALSDAAETDDISGVNIDYLATARNLVEEGYGNIRQALTEFAEKLKNAFVKEAVDSVSRIDLIENFGNAFDETLKEFLSND